MTVISPTSHIFKSVFPFFFRYDEANKDYDAILQDDPTNTVRRGNGKREGKIPLLKILLCLTLWSQLFGRP